MITSMKLAVLVCASMAILSDAKSIQSRQSDDKTPFEFEDVIPSTFGQRGFSGSWISGTEFTYMLNGDFVKYNVESKSDEKILTKEFIESQDLKGATFRVSGDLKKVLVRYDNRQIFRHSTVSKFTIVFLDFVEPSLKIADGGEVQIAFFSPNGNGLAYIQDNDIYYLDFDFSGNPKRVTSNGVPGVIYNGIPDWVYEEEVLGTDAATWFSPNGKKMAFIQFDDTNVREAVYDLYGDSDTDQYPKEVHLRYPKAGTTNPTIALFMTDLVTSADNQKLTVPTGIVTADHILGSVFWINEETLGAIWLNRRQDRGVFVSYDATTLVMTEIMEINEPNGWINVNTPKCDANSLCYFVNNYENWPTLTRVDTKKREDVKHLSSNGQTVLSLYGIQDGDFFFVSTPAKNESFNRHVYSSEGCLSCDILTPEGNSCDYASASFSRDFSYYALTCNGPDPSFTTIYKLGQKEEIVKWEDNAALRTKLETKIQPQIKIFHVPIEGGFNGVVRMLLPAQIDFDANDDMTKYPMLVRVYAGPGSIRILNSFSIGYQSYQVTKKNIIHVEIDGRGMSQNGNDMMFTVNNKLGSYEIDDQIAVTDYLVKKFKFIDPARVAIWGWSYGGYATAMTLAKDTEKVFKCGISVAPVTSWRFYDSIYTERYMGINSNATNYIESDVSTEKHVKEIGNHDFFLIHGNADDNVHYQQSMVLARALELKDIIFEQLSYPDEAHGISGTQKHLYHSMDRFWNRCFNLN